MRNLHINIPIPFEIKDNCFSSIVTCILIDPFRLWSFSLTSEQKN